MNRQRHEIADARIAIIGAASGIGRRLRVHGAQRIGAAIQRAPEAGCVPVKSYAEIPPDILAGCATAINCVGIATGSEEALQEVNVRTAVAAAKAAKAAGVRHFVQVSSFSIYGFAETIDHATPVAPVTAYGRSKLDAEQALAALNDTDFCVQCVRLPAIIGPGRDGKLASLARFTARSHLYLRPAGDVRRSMISEDMSARVLLGATGGAGAALAADPQPFTYAMLARAVANVTGKRPAGIAFPASLRAVTDRIAAGASHSLFRDSCLAAHDNLAQSLGMDSDLEPTLEGILKS